MSNMRIEDATIDDVVNGSELLPASDAGVPKSVSIGQIRDFIIQALLGAAYTTDIDGEFLFKDSDGNLRCAAVMPFIEEVFQGFKGRIMNNEAADSSMLSDYARLVVGDDGDIKAVLLSDFIGYMANHFTPAPSHITPADALSGDNGVVVDQGGPALATLTNLKDYVLGKLSEYVAGRNAVSSVNPSDVVFILQGGASRKCTVQQLAAASGAGDVFGPATTELTPNPTTENYIPQWDSVTRKLKNGLQLVSVKSAIEMAVNGEGGNVKTSGDQAIAGEKTFIASPIVPTPRDVDENVDILDSSQKAANTEFVRAVVASLTLADIHHLLIANKSFSSNTVALDDCSVNLLSIAVGDTCTAYVPDAVNGRSRFFVLVLTVTGSESGTVTLNLSGGTFSGEAADTFTIAPGKTHVITFAESGLSTGHFLVTRRTYETAGTAFTGTIA